MKLFFKGLAVLNKAVLPSLTKRRVDLSKASNSTDMGTASDIRLVRLSLVMPHAWDAVVSVKDSERRKINQVLDDQWEKSGKVIKELILKHINR